MSELTFGFHDLEHLANERIQQVGIQETNMRIMEWIAEQNRQFNTLFNQFTTRNERWNQNPITRVQTPGVGRMQFVDEHGVAKTRVEKGYYELGLPLWRYEDAVGISYEAMRRITVGEFNRQLASLETRDVLTAIDLFLFTIFYDAQWTFTSTEENVPDITVRPFANGDTVEYVVKGDGTMATADHYAAQANAIGNGADDPFPAMREALTKFVGMGDRVVCFVGGSTQVTNIKALNGFVPRYQTQSTIWGDNVSLVDPSADTFIGMGDEIIGEHEEGVLIVRWRRIPDNYLWAVNLDADMPVGIREDEAPDLRGLFNIDSVENSGNMLLRRFRRKIGFAAVNRVNNYVLRTGNGTYAPPTAYANIPG